MFCSTIIPTIGRESLARAVHSVLTQSFVEEEFEVIVVNDSGKPLPTEDWQQSSRVKIIDTQQRERSVARNAGATLAKGRFLHFLDDDDWLAPCAFQHLWALSQVGSARWLYGASQLMDRENRPTIRLRHDLQGNCFLNAMAGEWIPLQASLIERKAFLRVGGFNPLLTGPEDIDFLRRFTLEENVIGTPNLVAYIILGVVGSTTDFNQHPQASRWARETILDAPHAFSRLRLSASNAHWLGRLLRIYLTSVIWNLQRRRFFRSTSRGLYAAASLLAAGPRLFSPGFWRAVSTPYESLTFESGIHQARKEKRD